MSEPEDFWGQRLLHIIAQDDCHAEALILGVPAALRRLGEALIEASQTGQPVRVPDFMVTDGEGYPVVILPLDKALMDKTAPKPYAQLGLPWELERVKPGEGE
jgi:hypothetical protein